MKSESLFWSKSKTVLIEKRRVPELDPPAPAMHNNAL
jgi:hypothetical protein